MDESEFRKRVYGDPDTPGQDVLNAVADNPGYRGILEHARTWAGAVSRAVNDLRAPAELENRLLTIPVREPRQLAVARFQYYAMAACLVLAVAVTASLSLYRNPYTAELVLGGEVLAHIYVDEANNAAPGNGEAMLTATPVAASVIESALLEAGTRLLDANFVETATVLFAEPCLVLPASRSAHLVLQGGRGAVNVFMIANDSVTARYDIGDRRFAGVVVPMESGNLVLVGEQDEDLDVYRELVTQHVAWAI